MQFGVKDLVLEGRLRTSFCPLLNALPVVGAVQVPDSALLDVMITAVYSSACCAVWTVLWVRSMW